MVNRFRRNKLFSNLENFKTIHNPVNAFADATSDSVYPKKFILAVGRLDRQKGFDVLIDAFSKVRYLDVDLLISGQGDQKENLLRQILALGLMDRVKLVGFKDNLQDYYQQAELFVLSSRNEGYPNALVEAMSLGCPCISTDCEFGPSEIIRHGHNGLLVNPENADDLAQAILDVQTNIILKRRIAKNAQKINQTNSIDSISLKWEHLILSHV
jgi:glycosyltransferase involved in cell wall biosynthesis